MNIFYLFLIVLFFFISILNFTYSKAKEITIKNLKVTKVIDGDTIWVKNEKSKSYKIRFLGIDAPEICTVHIEEFGLEAKNYVEKLLTNEKIYIKYDTNNYKDKYGRVVAHIYREKDNLWINAALIKQGLAYVYILSPYILYLKELLLLENEAKKNNLNIWNLEYYQAIPPEEAKNFINKYKIIIGKVHKVSSSKNTILIEFQATNNQPNKAIKPCLSLNSIPLKVANNIKHKQYTVFSAKVNINSFPNNIDWKQYNGKNVIIRGHINQNNKSKNPFVNIVHLQSIDIFSNT